MKNGKVGRDDGGSFVTDGWQVGHIFTIPPNEMPQYIAGVHVTNHVGGRFRVVSLSDSEMVVEGVPGEETVGKI